MKNLLQLYACDLENLHPKVKNNLYKKNRKTFCKQVSVKEEPNNQRNSASNLKKRHKWGPDWKPTNTNKHVNSTEGYHLEGICIKILTDICIKSKYKIVKTIRISMDLVQNLIDFIPNLKVIHLVRDPRAITNSRTHSRNMKMSRETKTHSIALCKEMHLDVKVTQILKNKYPKGITMVMYEALAENPLEGAKYVYKFLGVKFDSVIEDWIYSSTHADNSNGFYGTRRANSTIASSHWRNETTIEKVDLIQNYCKDAMDLLGYVPFNTQEELRNTAIPARRSTKMPGYS